MRRIVSFIIFLYLDAKGRIIQQKILTDFDNFLCFVTVLDINLFHFVVLKAGKSAIILITSLGCAILVL